MSARVILLVLASMAMLPHAVAQEYHERLTDNELKAAYCLGFFKAGQQKLQNLCQNPTPSMAQACAASEQEQTAKTQRLLGYLVAKGIILSPGPNGLDAMGAVAQGRVDFQTCTNWSETPEATACMNKCPRQPASKWSACLVACSPTLCRKAATCNNLSFLPY